MKIKDTFIAGLKLIYPEVSIDSRGEFIKNFNSDLFEHYHLETTIKESYFSVSNKNVIRGMHFQKPPFAHAKFISVIRGSIMDVVVDLRKSSPAFGRYFSVEISSEKPVIVYVPMGCAHGFLCREDNTVISSLQTSVYDKNCDSGIHYGSFGMEWNISIPILSERDRTLSPFRESEFYFG